MYCDTISVFKNIFWQLITKSHFGATRTEIHEEFPTVRDSGYLFTRTDSIHDTTIPELVNLPASDQARRHAYCKAAVISKNME